MKKKFKVGSLFAGVGGICLGFAQAQNEHGEYELTWGNEIDEYACETYRTNFNHTLFEGDLRKILLPELVYKDIENLRNSIKKLEVEFATEFDEMKKGKIQKNILKKTKELQKKERNKDFDFKYYTLKHEEILREKIDVLSGGFPCQAFSIAGYQKGFEDDRGNLFLNIIDLIEQLGERHEKPRVLFLENVKNLKSHDDKKTYRFIKTELEKTGYTVKEAVLNTMDYSDLPQNRERIYIVGFLSQKDADKFDMFSRLNDFKKKKSSKERVEDIKRIIDYSLDDEKYFYTKEKYPKYFITEEEFQQIKNDKDNRINLEEDICEKHQFYQIRRGMYVRKNKSNVCPTLTANMGTGGHNVPLIKVDGGIRKLTPVETFRLQGFPIGKGYELPKRYKNREYSKGNLYKQAGNAVSVPIIKLLAEEILKILR